MRSELRMLATVLFSLGMTAPVWAVLSIEGYKHWSKAPLEVDRGRRVVRASVFTLVGLCWVGTAVLIYLGYYPHLNGTP